MLGSAHCDCGAQLKRALDVLSAAGRGVIILPAGHEGRGIGLFDKVKAYRAMRETPGLDTYAANVAVGHAEDARSFDECPNLLAALNVDSVVLLSSNPAKKKVLLDAGLLAESRALVTGVSPRNVEYLAAKAVRHDDAKLAKVVAAVRSGNGSGAVADSGKGSGPANDNATGSENGCASASDEATGGAPSAEEGIGDYRKSLLSAVALPKLTREAVVAARPRILVVRAAWHAPVISALVDEIARVMAEQYGVDVGAQIKQVVVPGSYELLYGVEAAAAKYAPDVVIAVGILIKGATAHFEYVSSAVVDGLVALQAKIGIPIVNGVLNVYDVDQAIERCDPTSDHCSGPSLALTALQMATFAASLDDEW